MSFERKSEGMMDAWVKSMIMKMMNCCEMGTSEV